MISDRLVWTEAGTHVPPELLPTWESWLSRYVTEKTLEYVEFVDFCGWITDTKVSIFPMSSNEFAFYMAFYHERTHIPRQWWWGLIDRYSLLFKEARSLYQPRQCGKTVIVNALHYEHRLYLIRNRLRVFAHYYHRNAQEARKACTPAELFTCPPIQITDELFLRCVVAMGVAHWVCGVSMSRRERVDSKYPVISVYFEDHAGVKYLMALKSGNISKEQLWYHPRTNWKSLPAYDPSKVDYIAGFLKQRRLKR